MNLSNNKHQFTTNINNGLYSIQQIPPFITEHMIQNTNNNINYTINQNRPDYNSMAIVTASENDNQQGTDYIEILSIPKKISQKNTNMRINQITIDSNTPPFIPHIINIENNDSLEILKGPDYNSITLDDTRKHAQQYTNISPKNGNEHTSIVPTNASNQRKYQFGKNNNRHNINPTNVIKQHVQSNNNRHNILNPNATEQHDQSNDRKDNIVDVTNVTQSHQQPDANVNPTNSDKLKYFGKTNYEFKTNKELVEFLEYGGLINLIYNTAINDNNELFKLIYLPITIKKTNNMQNSKNEIQYPSLNIYDHKSTNIIINSHNDYDYDHDYDYDYDNSKKDKKYLCKKNIFYDTLTTYINSERILNDSTIENIARFQYLVNTIFTKLAELYINGFKLTQNDIVFLYKGGTAMKIIYSEYKNLLQNFGSFETDANNVFNRSDSDYEYQINPNLNNFDMIYYHFSKITLLALYYIKIILHTNQSFFLNISSLNEEDCKIIINNINKKLEAIKKDWNDITKKKELEMSINCSNIVHIEEVIGISFNTNGNGRIEEKYFFTQEGITSINSQRKDFFITRNDDNKMVIGQIPFENNTPINFYISSNESINFIDKFKKPVSFMLDRIKYNFVVYYKEKNKYKHMNCPSEIIDISISKKNSHELESFYKNINTNINKYIYYFKPRTENELKVKYTSMSSSGFIHNLLKTLFYDTDFPWYDSKYNKRIIRLAFFIYLELIEKNKLEHINIIPNTFNQVNKMITSKNFVKVNRDEFDMFKNTMTYEFLTNYFELTISKFINNKNNSQLGKLDEFNTFMFNIFTELSKTKLPISISPKYDETHQNIIMNQIGGLYKQKLYKYYEKYKYLQNKLNLKKLNN